MTDTPDGISLLHEANAEAIRRRFESLTEDVKKLREIVESSSSLPRGLRLSANELMVASTTLSHRVMGKTSSSSLAQDTAFRVACGYEWRAPFMKASSLFDGRNTVEYHSQTCVKLKGHTGDHMSDIKCTYPNHAPGTEER